MAHSLQSVSLDYTPFSAAISSKVCVLHTTLEYLSNSSDEI